MRIIFMGRPFHRVNCHCGCVFEVTEEEADSKHCAFTKGYSIKSVDCPVCGRRNSWIEETGEKDERKE